MCIGIGGKVGLLAPLVGSRLLHTRVKPGCAWRIACLIIVSLLQLVVPVISHYCLQLDNCVGKIFGVELLVCGVMRHVLQPG